MYTYIFVLICIPTTTFLLKKIRLIIFIYSFRVSFNKIQFENKQIMISTRENILKIVNKGTLESKRLRTSNKQTQMTL